MSRIVFLNGSFLPIEEAKVPFMDRGFMFGDGVYEGIGMLDGRLIDNEAHLERLERSLAEIRIPNPYSRAEWTRLQEELARRNGMTEGFIYFQVTRGVAERDFFFPEDPKPTVAMFTQAKSIADAPAARTGIAVVTVPDLRWQRRDIKSINLLAQVLAKQAAKEAGAQEAWLVEDGFVTEGGSSSAFIVTKQGSIVVRPLSNAILPGITRKSLLRLSQEDGIVLEERRFTVEEAYDAAEAFLTSASNFVLPIVSIDGRPVADGKPGPVTARLRALYLQMASAPALAAE
ncbi:D-amino-acid transaminase [Microvirga lotononidis]|uniref:Probable branched-chain-amino-acid aminotransferase n=1 Tax=Microvirga lotononidis TaxID=864069 RepID=I4YUS5_9HYPH|nr:D-amino-acid transaminase [Microvirga lotononidis]EIM27717.1 branched-chain amino acid aminotransferase/4-amino-4-deoxychorismate lyase [Microvirga lotononidis]WQO28145.1 D-amino-acid transaminase [Microvirga lotononidis]